VNNFYEKTIYNTENNSAVAPVSEEIKPQRRDERRVSEGAPDSWKLRLAGEGSAELHRVPGFSL
jgi:hypothetical protein